MMASRFAARTAASEFSLSAREETRHSPLEASFGRRAWTLLKPGSPHSDAVFSHPNSRHPAQRCHLALWCPRSNDRSQVSRRSIVALGTFSSAFWTQVLPFDLLCRAPRAADGRLAPCWHHGTALAHDEWNSFPNSQFPPKGMSRPFHKSPFFRRLSERKAVVLLLVCFPFWRWIVLMPRCWPKNLPWMSDAFCCRGALGTRAGRNMDRNAWSTRVAFSVATLKSQVLTSFFSLSPLPFRYSTALLQHTI